MRMTMTDIKSMTQEEITDALRAMGHEVELVDDRI